MMMMILALTKLPAKDNACITFVILNVIISRSFRVIWRLSA